MTVNYHNVIIRDIVARAIRDQLIAWEQGFDLQRALQEYEKADSMTWLKALRYAHIQEFAAAVNALRNGQPIGPLSTKPQITVGPLPTPGVDNSAGVLQTASTGVAEQPVPLDPFGPPVTQALADFIL